ncbi:EamA family transporter [Dyella jejuensis]|uniref:EamA family transporter n=1 Tax=Dyella jejuensis TaxID=1432009 RepID=A0ABW8JPD4_9GAMM
MSQPAQYTVMFICVLGMALGQIMFKLAAQDFALSHTLLGLLTSRYFVFGGVVYAGTTLLWIWILTRVSLSHAYPFMALSFVIVPLLSYVFFREYLGWRYWTGIVLIVVGVLTTLTSSQTR